jgi:hypothetical protein
MSTEHRAKREATRPHWRFEDLEIWRAACDLAVKFHRIAEHLDTRRLYRYAEQLRAAGLSCGKKLKLCVPSADFRPLPAAPKPCAKAGHLIRQRTDLQWRTS